jgi:GTP-binding protein
VVNAKHGLNEADKVMLQDLDNQIQSGQIRWSLQAIITKADLVSCHNLDSTINGITKTIFENAPTCLPPIVTSCLKSDGQGVNDVRCSIVEACGLAR